MIRVMIVDDEPFVRNCLVTGVNWVDNGFEIVGVCKNGLDASEALKDAKPDVVISDVKMPYMDGIELLTYIRKNHPRMHVLIISGYEEFEYVKSALDQHADGYLLKPVVPEDLVRKMTEIAKTILRERREQKERRDPRNILCSALYGQFSAVWTTGIEDAYLELDEKYYAAMRVQVDNSGQRASVFEALERCFSGAEDAFIYEDSRRGHILLVSGQNVVNTRRYVEQYASQAAAVLERSGVLQFGVTVGDAHLGLEGVLVSLEEADASTFLRGVVNSERVFFRWRKYRGEYRSFRDKVLDIVRAMECEDRAGARKRIAQVFDAATGGSSNAAEFKRFSENLLYSLSENQGLLLLERNADALHECAGEIMLASGAAEVRRALDVLVI